jgi:hypothetical protein
MIREKRIHMNHKETLLDIIKSEGDCSLTRICCPEECFYHDKDSTDTYKCKLKFVPFAGVHETAVADFIEQYSKEELVEELL